MFVSVIFAAIVGAGIVLLNQGWKKRSFLLSLAGVVFLLVGVALFALNTMAEMKKTGVI
ncbi:hypothetical protein [Roseibium sp. M-1]